MRVSLQTMLIQPAALTVRGVYKSLRSMAEQKGSGATARRKGTILSLLRSCRQGLSRVTPQHSCVHTNCIRIRNGPSVLIA